MVNWVLRGAVLLWAVFFTILGAQGLLDPATYTETFGIAVDGAAANTVRADLSAFFLVAAGSAAIGALVRGWTGALLVPAALYGTALAGRLSVGDEGVVVHHGNRLASGIIRHGTAQHGHRQAGRHRQASARASRFGGAAPRARRWRRDARRDGPPPC